MLIVSVQMKKTRVSHSFMWYLRLYLLCRSYGLHGQVSTDSGTQHSTGDTVGRAGKNRDERCKLNFFLFLFIAVQFIVRLLPLFYWFFVLSDICVLTYAWLGVLYRAGAITWSAGPAMLSAVRSSTPVQSTLSPISAK